MAEHQRSESREGVVLTIAFFKLVKAAALIAIGVGALSLLHRDAAAEVDHVVRQLRVDPNNRFVHGIVAKIAGADAHELELVGVGTFVYAAIFAVEGVALFTRKPWAEWLTVIVTGSFIPLEVYEAVRHVTALRLVGIAVNVAVVVYLVLHVRKRSAHAESKPRRARMNDRSFGSDAFPHPAIPKRQTNS